MKGEKTRKAYMEKLISDWIMDLKARLDYIRLMKEKAIELSIRYPSHIDSETEVLKKKIEILKQIEKEGIKNSSCARLDVCESCLRDVAVQCCGVRRSAAACVRRVRQACVRYRDRSLCINGPESNKQ